MERSLGRAGPGQRCDRSIFLFSACFKAFILQQREAAPCYQQPIKASEIQAEHFRTFFHGTPACFGRRCRGCACPSIPARAQDEQLHGQVGEEGRSCCPPSQVRAAPGGKDKLPRASCPAVPGCGCAKFKLLLSQPPSAARAAPPVPVPVPIILP